jgi:hypothetical protein
MKIADRLLEMLRRRGVAREDDEPDAEDLRDIATRSGIADVDPEPLSHTAGEGIDLDRDVEAHEKIREQRERMPEPRH